MKAQHSPKVFFAILNMGLGHATRSLPIIREFFHRGWQVYIGASGRASIFLEQEVPKARFIELPDYKIEYDEDKVRLLKLSTFFPNLLIKTQKEQIFVEHIIRNHGIDLVVSDHRYGCYSSTVPSFFISHQLRFIAPKFLRPFEFIGKWFNQYFHKKYFGVIVPDLWGRNGGILSGRLSDMSRNEFYHFPGTLSSLSPQNENKHDIDILISISGPEPQRTTFESIIRNQLNQLSGKVVVGLGKPETNKREIIEPNIEIYHHLNRNHMNNLIQRSQVVVARSGYSTVMELAEFGKKALFIPTPGQTEQLYLANLYQSKGWIPAAQQSSLKLKKSIQQAKSFPGFPQKFSTENTVQNIFKIFENALKANKNRDR